jgi:hypothetical protein
MRVGGARCVPSARELAGALPPFRGVRSHAPPATSRPVAVVPRPVVAAPSMRILMCIRPKCAAPATSSLIGTGAGHCEGFTPRSTNGFEHRILRRQGSRREELWAPANLLLRQRGPEARGVLVGPVINVRRGRLRRPARPPRWSGSAIGNETHADAPWSAMPNGHARLADQALLGNARPLALRTDPEHALGDLHGVGAFPFRRFSPDAKSDKPVLERRNVPHAPDEYVVDARRTERRRVLARPRLVEDAEPGKAERTRRASSGVAARRRLSASETECPTSTGTRTAVACTRSAGAWSIFRISASLLFLGRDVAPFAERLSLREEVERRNLRSQLGRRKIQRLVATERLRLVGRLAGEIEELGHAVPADCIRSTRPDSTAGRVRQCQRRLRSRSLPVGGERSGLPDAGRCWAAASATSATMNGMSRMD